MITRSQLSYSKTFMYIHRTIAIVSLLSRLYICMHGQWHVTWFIVFVQLEDLVVSFTRVLELLQLHNWVLSVSKFILLLLNSGPQRC